MPALSPLVLRSVPLSIDPDEDAAAMRADLAACGVTPADLVLARGAGLLVLVLWPADLPRAQAVLARWV